MSRSSTTAPADTEGNVLVFEDAPEFRESRDSDTLPPEQDVESKVRAAKEHLQQLRQQQEEIEKQAQQLEELKKKQETFVAGKREMSDKLTRSLSNIEVTLEETRKQLEHLTVTRDNFSQHINLIRGLQPEKWQNGHTDEELDRALSLIEDAYEDYERGMRRIGQPKKQSKGPVGSIAAEEEDAVVQEQRNVSFTHSADGDDIALWFRRGFAFTLPLIATLIVGLIFAKFMF